MENFWETVHSLVRRIDESGHSLLSHPTSDENFNLLKIPQSILDAGFVRYRPYCLALGHRNPFSMHWKLVEATDYLAKVNYAKQVLQETFPIAEQQFKIAEGKQGIYIAVLTAKVDDNIEVLEAMMEHVGFFRSQPTDDKLLSDLKNREWIDIRFEPINVDDVTDEVRTVYEFVYHLTPSVNAEYIRKNGLICSNSNSEYRYSEPRVFVTTGDISDEELTELATELYYQAAAKHIPNLSSDYTLFKFELCKIPKRVRFFKDVNEEKGLYAKENIPPEAIVDSSRTVKANIRF